jgi:hypothetical protein
MLLERYRKDYTGEFVVTRTVFSNGKKTQEKEWLANPVTNIHISQRAAVIADSQDRRHFDYARLQRHRGGLHGQQRLQTYGNGRVWQHMTLDFVYTSSAADLHSMIHLDYPSRSTVYTNLVNVVANPGKFFIAPYTPLLNDFAMPIYLAAFDGHRQVYILGLNNDTPTTDRAWQQSVHQVFNVYDKVDFFLVGVAANMPTAWLENRNVKSITYRDFIYSCDI